jgi:hypothetical protein
VLARGSLGGLQEFLLPFWGRSFFIFKEVVRFGRRLVAELLQKTKSRRVLRRTYRRKF